MMFTVSKSDCGLIMSQVNEEVNKIICNERTDMSVWDRISAFTTKDMQCVSYPGQYAFQRQNHVSHITHDTHHTNDTRNNHTSLVTQSNCWLLCT